MQLNGPWKNADEQLKGDLLLLLMMTMMVPANADFLAAKIIEQLEQFTLILDQVPIPDALKQSRGILVRKIQDIMTFVDNMP